MTVLLVVHHAATGAVQSLFAVKISTAAVLAGISVGTPIVVALISKVGASHWVKTAVAVVTAASATLVASLTGVAGYVTVGKLSILFVVALALAGGGRFAWLKSIEDALNASGVKVFGRTFAEIGFGRPGQTGAADRAHTEATLAPPPDKDTGPAMTADELRAALPSPAAGTPTST